MAGEKPQQNNDEKACCHRQSLLLKEYQNQYRDESTDDGRDRIDMFCKDIRDPPCQHITKQSAANTGKKSEKDE